VQNSGDTAPEIPTVIESGMYQSTVTVGVNSGIVITLTAGVKDIYVVVIGSSSLSASAPLKIVAEVLSITGPVVDGKAYKTGDTGPAGGIIFYASIDGFTMTGIAGTCHYLEASPANLTGGTGSQAEMRWSTVTTMFYSISGTWSAIGSGKNNTALIIASESTNYPGNSYIYAARACSEYRGGGKDDWFLPSSDELDELYKAQGWPGIPTTGSFWSSSQYIYDSYMAWSQNLEFGIKNHGSKNVSYYVRAVRAF
jgi:hypothetical protein